MPDNQKRIAVSEDIAQQRRALMDKKMAERARNEQRRVDAREAFSAKARQNPHGRYPADDVDFDDGRPEPNYRPVTSRNLRIPENWRVLGSPAVKSLAVNLSGKPVRTREEAEDIVHKEIERRRKARVNLVTGRPRGEVDPYEVEKENLAGDGQPTANEGLRSYTVPKDQAKRGQHNPTRNEGLRSWEHDLEEDEYGTDPATKNEGVESYEVDEDDDREISGEGTDPTIEDDESNLKGHRPKKAKKVQSAPLTPLERKSRERRQRLKERKARRNKAAKKSRRRREEED